MTVYPSELLEASTDISWLDARWISFDCKSIKKIPHTGDKASLDRCG